MSKIVLAVESDVPMYMMCWTENETVFMTHDIEKAEPHRSEEEAIEAVARVNEKARRFLLDETDEELPRPLVRAYRATVAVSLSPIVVSPVECDGAAAG
jgi:hypothetical protein